MHIQPALAAMGPRVMMGKPIQDGKCSSVRHHMRLFQVAIGPQAEVDALAAAQAEDLQRCKGVLADRSGVEEGAHCLLPLPAVSPAICEPHQS